MTTIANSGAPPSIGLPIVARHSSLETRRNRISDAGVDLALLICVLFLGRFTLIFGHSLMELNIVPVVLIFTYQFISGRLLILYDRLVWFLAAAFLVTCSLLLNFASTMLPSYCLFIVMYALFTLNRPSTVGRYKSTLRAFQLLIAILSILAIAQFAAQFVVDGRKVVHFYGILPDFLFQAEYNERLNTIIPVAQGSSLIKSNGIFLGEPSALSQLAALAILIEVLEFRRPGYLLLFAISLLLSYSGTGLLLFFGFVPLAAIRYREARVPVLLVIAVVVGLVATGAIDLFSFTSRVAEFDDTQASGFERFISPFWLADEFFATAPLRVLLLGSGPGTMDAFAGAHWYGGFSGTWIKLIYEYGLIGMLIFICFLVSCLRKSRCPALLLAANLFGYVFLGGALLNVSALTMMVVLCTLSGPISPLDCFKRAEQSGPSFAIGSEAGS
jgi:hypothetical protein